MANITVDRVTTNDDGTTTIEGTSLDGSPVTGFHGEVVIGHGAMGPRGKFRITIRTVGNNPVVVEGGGMSVQVDLPSHRLTVVKAWHPTVGKVTTAADGATTIAGKSPDGSRVTVRHGETVLGRGEPNAHGNFTTTFRTAGTTPVVVEGGGMRVKVDLPSGTVNTVEPWHSPRVMFAGRRPADRASHVRKRAADLPSGG